MKKQSGYIDDNILRKVIFVYGEKAQLEMIQEECMESLKILKANEVPKPYNDRFVKRINKKSQW